MPFETSRAELPFQNFEHIIYINTDFYQDPPLPEKSGRSNFSGGQNGSLSADIIGHDDLLGSPVAYTIGAMHPADRKFGSYVGPDGTLLSAVAVAYNYTQGQSGLQHKADEHMRKLYLSAGPYHGFGAIHGQCSLLTAITASFELGLVFADNTMNTYFVPDGDAASADRGGAQAHPLTAVQYRGDNVGSNPNTRRKVALGYL